jgi:hypothetical protein
MRDGQTDLLFNEGTLKTMVFVQKNKQMSNTAIQGQIHHDTFHTLELSTYYVDSY